MKAPRAPLLRRRRTKLWTKLRAVLSPLLYSIYTSLIKDCIKTSNYHFYADDTQLIKSFIPEDIENAIRDINDDLNSIQAYSESRCLSLNSSKSQYVLIGNKQQLAKVNYNSAIKINNDTIERVDIAKNLGIYFDKYLRFEKLYVSGYYKHKKMKPT